MRKILLFIAIVSVFTILHAQGINITGLEILERIDDNEFYQTIEYNGSMTIYIDDQIRTKELYTLAKSDGRKALVEFTNPEDYGTKYLMMEDELWIYFPSEEEVVKISGHMLKEGMMGSDFSYEDALESDKISEKYNVEITGQDTLNSNLCWVITLNAKVKDVLYYSKKMWVDKDTFTVWKEEMFAKSGKLLKEMNVLEVKQYGGRYFPVKSEMVNKLRKNSKTQFVMKDISFDVVLPDGIFSIRNLQH